MIFLTIVAFLSLVFWFGSLSNDPVKHCPVYKEKGCCHVDGIECKYPECSILQKHYQTWFDEEDEL